MMEATSEETKKSSELMPNYTIPTHLLLAD
jgi:hypothetical protein